MFRRTGKALGGLKVVTLPQFTDALDKGLVAVVELGAAEPGDTPLRSIPERP